MEPIRRIGPPTPIAMRDAEYDLCVSLSALPSADWRRAFHAPENWKEPCHPSRVTVKDRTLLFTSEGSQVRLWMQLIDGWIAEANQVCADLAESVARRRAEQQSEDEQERRRRLQEATERFKDL